MPTFGPVLEVARLMRGFPRPWYIAGGWAIDLFLRRETREHDDIDVAILRKDQAELRTHLAAWAFEKVVDGQRLPWLDGERLDLPVHEVHATSETRARVEFLLNESSGASWQFRRNPAITRRLDRIGMRTSLPCRSSFLRSSCCSRPKPWELGTPGISTSPNPACGPNRAVG